AAALLEGGHLDGRLVVSRGHQLATSVASRQMQLKVAAGTPSITTLLGFTDVIRQSLNAIDLKVQSVPRFSLSPSENVWRFSAIAVSVATMGPIAFTVMVNVKVCGWTT